MCCFEGVQCSSLASSTSRSSSNSTTTPLVTAGVTSLTTRKSAGEAGGAGRRYCFVCTAVSQCTQADPCTHYHANHPHRSVKSGRGFMRSIQRLTSSTSSFACCWTASHRDAPPLNAEMLNGTLMAVPAFLKTCIVAAIYGVTSQVDLDLYGTIYQLLNPEPPLRPKRETYCSPSTQRPRGVERACACGRGRSSYSPPYAPPSYFPVKRRSVSCEHVVGTSPSRFLVPHSLGHLCLARRLRHRQMMVVWPWW